MLALVKLRDEYAGLPRVLGMMDHNTRAHNVIYEWARLTITSEGWWCRDCGEAFFEAPETSHVFEALQEVKRRVEAAHARSAQAAPIVEGGAAR